jgi:outer membrane immunogenic protein
VLGVETDFDWTDLSRNSSFVGASFVDPIFLRNDFLTENSSRKLDWLGTTRLRAGFVATPDNRLMFYGTGGFAYGGGSRHFDVFDNVDGWDWNGGGGSQTRTGWTIGGGVEYAITNNITLKGEYLYYDLGSTHSVIIANPPASAFFPNTYATAKINFDGSIARVGINYKF